MCQTCQPEATATQTATEEQPLRFESETCSRCGGGGYFQHFAGVWGGRCFKCGGAGKLLTKKGAAANAWLIALRTRKASELEVGQYIRCDRITMGGQSYRVTGLITRIGLSETAKWQDKTTGEWKPYLEIETKEGKKGETGVSQVFADSTFIRVFPREEARAQVRAAIEYQNTLSKAGKPRKR